jgi:putative Holliday junction resolvase
MDSSPVAARSTRAKSADGRVLAIDYGQKRIGLAISDEAGITARPLTTLIRTNRRNDLRRLRLLARKHRVCCVVVGLPLHLDGRMSEMALEAKRFGVRLEKGLGIPVELVDERLSSWEAAEISPSKRATNGGRKSAPQTTGHSAPRDHIAAAIILRDYLADRRLRGPASHARVKS